MFGSTNVIFQFLPLLCLCYHCSFFSYCDLFIDPLGSTTCSKWEEKGNNFLATALRGLCVCENRYHIRYTFDYAGEWWAMMKSPLNEDASSFAVIWRRDAFVTYLHNLNCWTSCHHFVVYLQQAPFRFGFRLHEGDLGEQATASSIFIILKPILSSVWNIWTDVKLLTVVFSVFTRMSLLLNLQQGARNPCLSVLANEDQTAWGWKRTCNFPICRQWQPAKPRTGASFSNSLSNQTWTFGLPFDVTLMPVRFLQSVKVGTIWLGW